MGAELKLSREGHFVCMVEDVELHQAAFVVQERRAWVKSLRQATCATQEHLSPVVSKNALVHVCRHSCLHAHVNSSHGC